MRRITQIVLCLALLAVPLKSGSIGSARTACPTSGALAVSATSIPAAWWIIQAPFANAGSIYVGQTAVSSTTGAEIKAGGSITAQARGGASASYNMNQVFFACGTNTDAIVYVYAQ